MIRTLLDLIPRMEQLGHREAVRSSNGYRSWIYSYAELCSRIAAVSHFFESQKIVKGDRILLWGENSLAWISAYWAAVAQGIQVVPLDTFFSPHLVEQIQTAVEARLLVHGNGVEAASIAVEALGFSDLDRLPFIRPLKTAEVTPDDVVEIVYTSGTTGDPKGVVHRHRNLCANLRPFAAELARYRRLARPFQPVRFLEMLPLSHMFGQSTGLFIPVLLGGSVVFMQDLAPGTVLQTIHEERVSVLVAVPRLVAQLQRHIQRRFGDLDQPIRTRGYWSIAEKWWRYRRVHSDLGWKFWSIVVGGAQLRPELEAFWSRIGVLVVQGYGLTEASPIVAVNHPFRSTQGSIGKPVEGQEVKLAPDGEILVRGESVVSEYFGDEKESGATHGQWLHTGDVGEMDEEGRLFFKGRKKDVIVTSDGLNVYPEDIEDVLTAFVELQEAAVVGLEKNSEEIVHAVLRYRGDAPATEETEHLIRRANRKLESHQRIRSWSVWCRELPRTGSTGKVKRGVVRDILKSESLGAETEASQKPDLSLDALLARLSGTQATSLADDQRLSEDLGLSSLDRIALLTGLEESFEILVEEERFSRIETVGQLRKLVGLEQGRRMASGPVPDKSQHDSVAGPDPPASLQLPRWNRSWWARALRSLSQRSFILPIFRHYIELDVEGLSYLEGVSPPVILAANHNSHLDTLGVLAALPFSWRRRIAPAMLREYFQAYFHPRGEPLLERLRMGVLYHAACFFFNAYPLPQRMGGIRQVLKYTGELVEEGYCPLVFPEGIRSPDGTLQPFKPGIGLMAVRLQVPVVPIHMEGMFEILSVHDSWPSRGPVRVRVGKPITFGVQEEYQEAADRIRKEMMILSASTR